MTGARIGAEALYARVSEHAAALGVALSPEELAGLTVRGDMGEGELAALEAVFSHLADKRHDQVIGTLLKLSRLPQRAPKTFEGFDFGRIRGRDAAALRTLPALSNLHARKNLAFIGPGGIGKTHLAQAYERECCLAGYKTYYLKATELRDKLKRASESGSTSRAVASLVKPSCLIVDEVGRCTFDKACTDLFFDVVDRRYEKECPQHDDPDEQHTHEQLGRVLHRRRHAAVRARPAVRPRVGVHDEGRELPRGGARDILGRIIAHGDQDQ